MRPTVKNDRQQSKKIRVRSTFISAFALLLASNLAQAVVPTAPTNLIATGIPSSHIALSWTDNSNNETSFKIERKTGSGGTYSQIATAPSNVVTFEDSGLTIGTTYFYRVRASNSSGNSAYTNVASVTLSGDSISPTAVTGLTATVVSSSQINLSWTASTDNVGVAGYRISRCQANGGCINYALIATVTTTTFSDTGLTATNGTYVNYIVVAFDAAGNWSSATLLQYVNLTGDTTPPSAPSGLTVTAVSATQIDLSWTASTDNLAVAGYRLERCQGVGCGSLDSDFGLIGAPTGTTFSDTGLTVATTYKYRVRAADTAGNVSAYSNIATVTTQVPDTTAPTAPTGLSALAASTTQINLTWSASTDNIGVTSYLVERCAGSGCIGFVQIAAPAATSLSDTSLSAGTIYNYRVRATDAAGNLSAYSSVVSATTTSQQAQIYYIEPDQLNTPRMITNQQGQTVWRNDNTEPFGNSTPNINPSGLGPFDFPLRFPGQYLDQETNLAHNYFRNYNPGLGRYSESDPIGLGGGINPYAYANSNPIVRIDPYGLWSTDAHNLFIYYFTSSAFPDISTTQLNAIYAGSAFADTLQFQMPEYSYMHAMSSSRWNREEAKKMMCEFAKQNLDAFRLRVQTDPQSAFFYLGVALHPIMDATSPVHRGFQYWPGETAGFHGSGWPSREDIDTARSYLSETVSQMTQALNGNLAGCGCK